jgi:hypothetical protein
VLWHEVDGHQKGRPNRCNRHEATFQRKSRVGAAEWCCGSNSVQAR